MRISAHWYVPLLALVASCGGGGSGEAAKPADAPVTVVEKALPSVSDVLALVYDNNYQVPADFFVDARASTAQSYTMHHGLDESRSFEMCTNDFATAQALEAADNESRAVQGRFVGTVETDRYFEFARELSYSASIGNIVYNELDLGPCTAVASVELLKSTGASLSGLEAVVIGPGRDERRDDAAAQRKRRGRFIHDGSSERFAGEAESSAVAVTKAGCGSAAIVSDLAVVLRGQM